MTSAATLHCPHCMAEVPKRMVANVPGLILIDRYYCWNCGTMTIREELVEERKLNVLRSGQIPIPPEPSRFVSSGGSASKVDFVNGFTDLSSPQFISIANELVVCAVASLSGYPPDSVLCGGSPMAMAVLEDSLGAVLSSVWYIANAPVGPSQVVASWTSQGPTGIAALGVLRFHGYTTIHNLASDSTTANAVGIFDSGLAGPQAASGYAGVAMVGLNGAGGVSDVLFGDSFSNELEEIIEDGNGNQFGVAMGARLIADTSSVQSTGSYNAQANNAAIVLVFEP